MICLRCGKTSPLGEGYCNACFLAIVEKRMRRALRDSKKLYPGVLLVVGDKALRNILQKLVTMPATIASKSRTKSAIHVSGNTIDDQVVVFLKDYLDYEKENKENKENKKEMKEKQKGINLFETLTDSELQRYFQLKQKKKFTPKKDELKDQLAPLIKKYPEVRYALYNSITAYKKMVLK